MKVEAKAPGKLYLAGEYAVVEAGYPAIIAAVDQYLSVTIEKAAEEGSIHSSQQPDLYLAWSRKEEEIWIASPHPYGLIQTAMTLTESYLRRLGLSVQGVYRLDVTSELDDATTGTKYGLGSSGAVTVATVKALLAYYGQEASPELVYKLSVLTQMSCEMTGSFGDIAASSYGGVIAYHSLDRAWLKEQMKELPLLSLLEKKWQGFSVQQLTLPAGLALLVGWTGTAASTEQLVGQSRPSSHQQEQVRKHFLQESQICLEDLIEAFQCGDAEWVKQGLVHNRQILRTFAEGTGFIMETPLLQKLCDLALQEGAVAKTSGAGGGDCGICLVESSEQGRRICQAWQTVGILPLTLSIADRE